MENYVMLDNRKFEINDSFAELLRGVIREKIEKEKEKNPFTRVSIGEDYWYISREGIPYIDKDSGHRTDDNCYNIANYCTDKKLMEQRALHETLNRLLWRFNEIHGGDVQRDGDNNHFYIVYNKINNEYLVKDCAYGRAQGTICFPSAKRAQEAIETIVKPFVAKHPDFVW